MEFSFRKVDWSLFISFIVLLIIGFAVLTSASQVLGFQKFADSYHFVKQQALHAVVGVVLFFIFFFFPPTYWRRFAFLFYVVGGALLALVFVPGVGASFGKALSWIKIGGFSFQPAELVKLFYILFLAFWFERKESHRTSFLNGTVPFLLYSSVIFLLIALQPDVGTLAIMVVVGVVVYFVSGAPAKYFAVLAMLAVMMFGVMVAVAPYRLNRILVFLNPSLDPQGAGYHAQQALVAVGSGGLLGQGFGKSQSKFNFLPEAAGDSVFAVYAEELGFVFVVLLFLLFAVILLRGMRGAESAKTPFEKYAAVGVVTWMVFQAVVNIGAMIGFLPLTGIPLPFVSYGGTALVSEMAGMGLLLNICRR